MFFRKVLFLIPLVFFSVMVITVFSQTTDSVDGEVDLLINQSIKNMCQASVLSMCTGELLSSTCEETLVSQKEMCRSEFESINSINSQLTYDELKERGPIPQHGATHCLLEQLKIVLELEGENIDACLTALEN